MLGRCLSLACCRPDSGMYGVCCMQALSADDTALQHMLLCPGMVPAIAQILAWHNDDVPAWQLRRAKVRHAGVHACAQMGMVGCMPHYGTLGGIPGWHDPSNGLSKPGLQATEDLNWPLPARPLLCCRCKPRGW